MIKLFSSLSPSDYGRLVIETIILTYFIYKLYMAVAETRARELASILVTIAILYGFSYLLKLKVILTLMKMLIVPFFMVLAVFYTPELRRAFTGVQRRGFFRSSQTSSSQIDSILSACETLVEKKRGALIVFPRQTDIKSHINVGTKLNADLSTSLILTIFDHDTPLHDGACIIQGSKITLAGCFLPVSQQTAIENTFGTRHRAALGLTEETDAIVLVVSEETGSISICYNANIYYNLDREVIKEMLIMLLSGKDVVPQDIKIESNKEDDANAVAE